MFGLFKWSRSRLDLFVKVCGGLAVLLALICLLGWGKIDPWLKTNENALKLVSYVFGPLLALLGFILGIKDKLDLTESAANLGDQRRAATEAEKRAKAAEEIARDESATARKLRGELEGITKGADQLWKLRPPRPFAGFRERMLETEGARCVAIVNLKGGVGKTTIAANYAAYLSEHLRKRVLVVDLDYQGSLSGMLLQSVGRPDQGSQVDSLFLHGANFLTVDAARTHLVPTAPDIPMRMSQSWLVPAGTSLAQLENQLLLSWLLESPDQIDVRYRLAHVLLDPNVRRQYDVILFDLPPRMTLGAINALVASNYFFIPTVLDGLSTEAVPLLLSNLKSLKEDMSLQVDLAGIIGTLTQTHSPSARERVNLENANDQAQQRWANRADFDYALPIVIPKRAHLSEAAGNSIALLEADIGGNPVPPILTALFDEMSKRIGISGK